MPKGPSTRRDALLLTNAGAFRSAVQLLTPLVLVRILDQTEFGEYRLFWLVANTAILLLPLGMERSLLYFLPKSNQLERFRYVSQTLFYFLCVAGLASVILLIASYWFPSKVSDLTEPPWILAAFTLLWVLSAPVRVLPNADQNIPWQARAIVVISLLRALAVVGTALTFRTLNAVFIGLLAWSVVQYLIMVYYVISRYGFRLPKPRVRGLTDQLAFAVPFGLSQTLTGARLQIEQWIVALLFAPASLGIFSIGIAFNAVLQLSRSSLGNVLLPKMSKSHAAGNTARALELNNRGNLAVFTVLTPIIACLWIFAPQIISTLYTDAYSEAVPILRIYLIALIAKSIELGSVLMVLEQGRFVAKVSGGLLLFTAIFSYSGAVLLGLTGVALGSLFGEIINRYVNFTRASKVLKIRFRDLQDWITLGKVMVSSLCAAGLTILIVSGLLAIPESLVSAAIGTVIFFVAYLAMLWLQGLTWLLSSLVGFQQWGATKPKE